MKKTLKRLAVTAAATAMAATGALVATAPTAAAANLKVKNHGTTMNLYLRDSCGSEWLQPGASGYLSCSGRQAWVPRGWILTKDSVQWRSACGGVSPYWAGFSWQPTTVDIRWVKCRN